MIILLTLVRQQRLHDRSASGTIPNLYNAKLAISPASDSTLQHQALHAPAAIREGFNPLNA
jgi:hypothetical protein